MVSGVMRNAHQRSTREDHRIGGTAGSGGPVGSEHVFVERHDRAGAVDDGVADACRLD